MQQDTPRKKRDWWALGTNLAVIGTALVSYLTLNQVKNQNEFAQRADVVVSLEQGSFESKFTHKDSVTSFTVPDSVLKNFNIRLINIGLGPGKSLKIDWKTDYEKFQDSIQLGKRWLKTGIRLNKKDGSLIIGNRIYYYISNSGADFILPVSQEQKPLLEEIRSDFFQVWNQCMGAILKTAGDDLDLLETLLRDFTRQYSRVPMSLEYTDLFQVVHRKTFSLSFVPYFINMGDQTVAVDINMEELHGPIAPEVIQCVLFHPKDNSTRKIDMRIE